MRDSSYLRRACDRSEHARMLRGSGRDCIRRRECRKNVVSNIVRDSSVTVVTATKIVDMRDRSCPKSGLVCRRSRVARGLGQATCRLEVLGLADSLISFRRRKAVFLSRVPFIAPAVRQAQPAPSVTLMEREPKYDLSSLRHIVASTPVPPKDTPSHALKTKCVLGAGGRHNIQFVIAISLHRVALVACVHLCPLVTDSVMLVNPPPPVIANFQALYYCNPFA